MAFLENAPNFVRTAQNPCTGQDFWCKPSGAHEATSMSAAACNAKLGAQGLSPNQVVMPHKSATLSSTAAPISS